MAFVRACSLMREKWQITLCATRIRIALLINSLKSEENRKWGFSFMRGVAMIR